MDYADVTDLHVYGNFQTETDDALLASLITAASTLVENFCHRVFAIADGAATVTRTFTADNGRLVTHGRTLYLDADLCSTPTIATLTGGATVTSVPPITPYNRLVRDGGTWEDPTTIQGHWAYSLTPPEPIKYAAIRLALWLYRQRDSTDSDRPVLMDGMVIMPAKLPEDVIAILAPYRRVNLP